jgi:hypothetical protein
VLVDGDSGMPVDASVVVAGVSVATGSPLPNAIAEGATVDVNLQGFLSRQTLVRTGETRLVLWPDSASLPADYTRSIVYTSSTDDQGQPILTGLRRLPTRVRSVSLFRLSSRAIRTRSRRTATRSTGSTR